MRSKLQILLSILSTTILAAGISAFALYHWGQELIKLEKNYTTQTKQIITIVNEMTTSDINPKERVIISERMAKIVKNLNNNPEHDFQVEEIFILDSKGKILAHSNVMRMAKEYQKAYHKAEYNPTTLLKHLQDFPKDNVSGSTSTPIVQFLEYQEIELTKSAKRLFSFLGIEKAKLAIPFFLPEKFASRYLVSVIHHSEQKTAASLHLIGTPTNVFNYLNIVSYYKNHYIYLIGYAAILIVFFFGLYGLHSKTTEKSILAYVPSSPLNPPFNQNVPTQLQSVVPQTVAYQNVPNPAYQTTVRQHVTPPPQPTVYQQQPISDPYQATVRQSMPTQHSQQHKVPLHVQRPAYVAEAIPLHDDTPVMNGNV